MVLEMSNLKWLNLLYLWYSPIVNCVYAFYIVMNVGHAVFELESKLILKSERRYCIQSKKLKAFFWGLLKTNFSTDKKFCKANS